MWAVCLFFFNLNLEEFMQLIVKWILTGFHWNGISSFSYTKRSHSIFIERGKNGSIAKINYLLAVEIKFKSEFTKSSIQRSRILFSIDTNKNTLDLNNYLINDFIVMCHRDISDIFMKIIILLLQKDINMIYYTF